MEDDNGKTKYLIKSSIKTDGVVERPDVVGAVFGQTEGVLGEDLDLRELQKNGKIGRINVNVKSENGKSKGNISIPSSLSKNKTAMVAAALETIDRVGPCEAEIEIDQIQDTRQAKRQFIKERAEELVDKIEEISEPKSKKRSRKGSGQGKNVVKYKGLPAGPTASRSDAIIVVEGRSDVINLLEQGIKNTVAIEGTSVPSVISEITKKKTTTVFLDGDRGGDLILKEMLQVADVNYVARAPDGMTVEDLSGEEIREALKSKKPLEKISPEKRGESGKTEEEKLHELAKELKSTSDGVILDEDLEEIEKVKVRDLPEKLDNVESARAVVFDGVITQNLADLSDDKDITYLIGMRERVKEKPKGLKIMTKKDLE